MVIQDLTWKYLPSPSGSSLLSQKSNTLEVTECVNEMKNGARGSDLVPLNVVKAILSFILPMLVEIANGFFNDETFPDIFKRARIVPLHRNGDKDVAVISNRYRLYLYFPEFKLAITEKQHSRSDRMCEQDEKWRQRIRLEIANGFFNDETFPDIFKRARIVPLHRNGDKDVAVISNRYRLYLYFPEFKLAITEKQHSRSDRMCEQDEKWRQRIRLEIANGFFNDETFPDIFKRARIVPLHRNGDKDVANSSLLSQKSNTLEVTECVNKMKNGARGSDLVPPNVVKAILSFILPMLVEIANGFFNDETFPDIFKRARIVPLHRNGDKDVAVISNRYRLYLYFPEFKLAITEKQHSRSDRMCEQDEKWRQRIRLGTSKCC
ncbi:hypothetical protein QYM36_003318 [Artemia franciscana]|uniref:Uncharacterized protein n=1 Tax=Artemia franciscana TaxID=6661 RepID=A0AA88I849_ARTSF|nr:hypothetical protein QYM36_003318 [Artemia franciscana]